MKLLILSDIHGNLPALEAVLEAERGFDAVAFCGDLVDYGPFPVESIAWLRKHAEHAVRGNHDNALAFDKDCHCQMLSPEASLATRQWHRSLVSTADLEFLQSLPTLDFFEWQGRHFRVSHGTPFGNPFEYLHEDQWEPLLGDIDADYVLLGHTHVQGIQRHGKVTVINPGSVGFARDRRGLAAYAVYEDGEIQLKRAEYDRQRTIRALRESPLPPRVITALLKFLGENNGQ